MSLAAAAREAARRQPFLHDALRAGVVNYAAAARFLATDTPALAAADEEAVTAALRRFAEDLPPYEPPGADRVRVNMQSRLGPTDDPETALLAVGDTLLAADGGDLTAITATGDGIDPVALAHVVGALDAEGAAVGAAGAADGVLVVVVNRRDGPDALRVVEECL